jgi:hypothetical protein
MFDACICDTPDDTITLLSRAHPVARKEHKCGECGHPIGIGQRYEVDTGIDGRDFVTYKTCIPCCNVRDSLMPCGWYYGMVWETIHGQYCGEDEDGDCICPEPCKVKL